MADFQLSMSMRLLRRLLTLPEPLLSRIIGRAPIIQDGRVLNRRVQALLALGERTGRGRPGLDVALMRQSLRRLGRLGMPGAISVYAVDRYIPGPAGDLRIRIYRSFGAEPDPAAILYLHGGGWVTGDLESHDGSCRLLARTTGCTIIAVDYRLAPEHPFPAAIDDAVATYVWAHTHTDELSIAPGRIGVMGDSAGGNLSAVLALEARNLDVPRPIAQGLIYPAVDLPFDFPSHRSFGTGFGLDTPVLHWFRRLYAPRESDWTSPRLSPIRAADLSGLPPALVVTAGFDPLRDEGKAYAEALAAAGTPVRYRCYDDMIHGFFGMGLLPEGMAIATEICAAMGKLMEATPGTQNPRPAQSTT